MQHYSIQMIEADLDEVVELEKSAGLSSWGYDNYRSSLLYDLTYIMLVARSDEPAAIFHRILGFLTAQILPSSIGMDNELHIHNIAVSENFKRLGIGKSLIKELMFLAKNYSVSRMLLEVRVSNVGAQQFYKKLGFQLLSNRRNYYSSPTEDALVLEYLFKKYPTR